MVSNTRIYVCLIFVFCIAIINVLEGQKTTPSLQKSDYLVEENSESFTNDIKRYNSSPARSYTQGDESNITLINNHQQVDSSALVVSQMQFLSNVSVLREELKLSLKEISNLKRILLGTFIVFLTIISYLFFRLFKDHSRSIPIKSSLLKEHIVDENKPIDEEKAITENNTLDADDITDDRMEGSGFLLSDKQKFIAELIVQGLTKKEIASQLNVSVNTVKYHVKVIYKNLEVNNKAELIERINQST